MNSWKHLPDTSSAAAPPGSVIKMTLSPARCFILLLILSYVDAGRIFWEMKERVREVQLQRAEQLLLAKVSRGQQHFQHVKSGSLEQQLDHFNRQDSKTFRQKYLVNNKYWKKPDGPVFLYIGGEGPLNFVDVFFGHHVEMAKKHDALLVALEHRFYGKSINPDGLKMENLASLSSEQALVDLAVFHEHISHSFNLTRNNTWISFGGSYAGALSAWLKRKFPHLVFAAVASSAPVRAKLDFSAYCKRVGLGLLNERVGGSLKCFSEVQKAFAALEAALMAGDVCQVATDFNCCQEPTELDDQINLMQSLADIFMGTVQYNDEFMNINMICDVMTNKARDDEREGYGGLVRLSKMLFGARCLEVSLKNELNYLMNTTVGRGSYRQWIYQTCTEFGFCQSCEDAMCPFSRMISLKYQEKICQSVFGISPRSLNRHVAFSNTYYGGDCPTTHRVLYVNGEIDPWRELSVVEGCTVDGEKVHAVLIKDVAHCADMLSDQVDDRASLKSGRKEIENYVTDFLRTAEVEKLEKRCD